MTVITLPPTPEYDAAAKELQEANELQQLLRNATVLANMRVDRARTRLSELFNERVARASHQQIASASK